MITLEICLQPLCPGGAIAHEDLTLVPLTGDGYCRLDHLLAADAIAAGVLTVTEVGEGGQVPILRAVNSADCPVLLVDGEELVGAKQNRILNTSILLAGKSETLIPVSCVEQGRWRYASPGFAAGMYSPPRLRARKSRDVGRNLRATGQAASDQGAVWDQVAENLNALGASSPTMSMHETFVARKAALDEFLRAMPYPAQARGVMVFIGGGFAALDVFDRPETLERLWPRLLRGYALDVMARRNMPDMARMHVAPAVVMERLRLMACRPCPSVGMGEDWRFEADDFVGQALIVGETCVHLCAFPNANPGGSQSHGPAAHIRPPSQRRRQKRPPKSDAT